jgi:hypothetical protein
MTNDQARIWEHEKRAVRALQDGLGRPVDQPVVETVAILRLLGLHTTSSCGGHADRTLSPYIAFRSPRTSALRPRTANVNDEATARRLRRMTLKANADELASLLPLLDRFYETRDNPQSQRLIVQGFGLIGYRLTVQSADLLLTTPRQARPALLKRQRDQLNDFTRFLVAEYFAQ